MKSVQSAQATESWKLSLVRRSITGFVIVVIVSAAALNEATFLLLVLVLNYLALMEFQNLVHKLGYNPHKIAAQILGLLILLVTWLVFHYHWSAPFFLLLIPFVFLQFVFELFRKKPTPFENIALSLLGNIWISIPLALFFSLCHFPFATLQYEPFMPLGYFFILWLGDTGAYFVGRFAGKHKLFYRISPNKTWEGSVGGGISAVFAGFLNFKLFNHLPLNHWLLLALVINVTGTFGDFTKSLLKRSVGVKDSGTILPGHGGILDRFDSLVGSVPFAFIYLWLYAWVHNEIHRQVLFYQ